MKKLNLFILIGIIGFFISESFSQQETTVWYEDFESGIGGWYVDNGTWQVGIPTSGPGAAHGGTQCAATILDGNYSDNQESRLIRYNWFTVPSASENPRLRLWHWYSFSSADWGKVQIKTSTSGWITVSNTFSGTSSSIWANTFVDLSAYADSLIQIGFYFYSSNSGGGNVDVSSGWYIDDIELRTGTFVFNNPETWELGIGDWWVSDGTWEVGEPSSGPGSAYNGTNCLATRLGGDYSDYADASRFTSPLITIPSAAENPRLRFWHWFSFSSGDYGKVQIKTPTSSWIDLSSNITGNSSGAYTYKFLDLISYADSVVQIGFYFYANNSGGGSVDVSSGWYIDDVLIEDNSGLYVELGPDVTLPYGGSTFIFTQVMGGTMPYTVQWTPPDGLSDPTILYPTASPLMTTTYQVKVTDANGCFRTDFLTIFIPYSLDLKAHLEGPYNGTTMNTDLNGGGYLPLSQPFDQPPWNYAGTENVASIPNADIVDWALVELRETPYDAALANSYTRIHQFAAFIKNDGSIVDIDGINLPKFYLPVTDNLYVAVWHRNHLGILSANPITPVNGTYTYDYTSSVSNIYGGVLGCKELTAGVWGMVAGDALGNGNINNLDKNDIWYSQYGLTGYNSGDFNLDGSVDDTDKNNFWIPNTGMGTQVE